jgi:hypothetical protein
MIASQHIGKSFMGALGYNLRKLNHKDPEKRAELLATNFDCSNLEEIKREVDLMRELRPNLNRYVYHTSLNFAPGEEALLDNRQLIAIAQEYLERNGFNNNQYFIFRHYDAEHPHLHVLANRIRFDGSVVPDSHNYKRSEEIVRKLEERYHLTTVAPSRGNKIRAAKKNEIEMALRTGRPSGKMLLQEKLKLLLNQKGLTIQQLILKGEAQGIHFLFNQASTGRISGITYFHEGFKITGKILGNRFKWSELIKQVNYEQVRDGEAVSQANSRTRATYGNSERSNLKQDNDRRKNRNRNDELYPGGSAGVNADPGKQGNDRQNGSEIQRDNSAQQKTSESYDRSYDAYAGDEYDHNYDVAFPQISDDADDEAVYGKERRKYRGLER